MQVAPFHWKGPRLNEDDPGIVVSLLWCDVTSFLTMMDSIQTMSQEENLFSLKLLFVRVFDKQQESDWDGGEAFEARGWCYMGVHFEIIVRLYIYNI